MHFGEREIFLRLTIVHRGISICELLLGWGFDFWLVNSDSRLRIQGAIMEMRMLENLEKQERLGLIEKREPS